MSEIQEKLLQLLERKFRQRPAPDESFAAIGVDSLAMAELVVEIEQMFAVETDDRILEVDTVDELAAYVQQLRGEARTDR
jgi:acyl carrier protein